jgi:hypothetical protein
VAPHAKHVAAVAAPMRPLRPAAGGERKCCRQNQRARKMPEKKQLPDSVGEPGNISSRQGPALPAAGPRCQEARPRRDAGCR